MTKILYAVNGDGLGHATRSIPIILELSKKYDVKVMIGSKRSGDLIKKYVKNVIVFEGLRFSYDDNSVKLYRTISSNAKIVFSRSSNFRKVYKIIKQLRPNVIVTDCDYLTINVANLFSIPIICVCNIHSITELRYSVPKRYVKSYYATRILTKTFTHNVDYHILTTFFSLPAIHPESTFQFSPILRKEVYSLDVGRKNYYIVYQTSGYTPVSTNRKLIKALKSVDAKFIVYGFERDDTEGNITFRKTNNDQFFNDLKDCRACIANGGYGFISEAVSLHKPILSIPIKGQFEQIFNALQVKKLGYGNMCDIINKKSLQEFIKNNDKYYMNIKNFKKEDNTRLVNKLVELIQKVSKG